MIDLGRMFYAIFVPQNKINEINVSN